MNWLTIKTKLIALGAVVVAGLVFFLDWIRRGKKIDSLEDRNDDLQAQVDQAEAIDAAEAELDSYYSDLEREAERDLTTGKMPDVVRNRNRK